MKKNSGLQPASMLIPVLFTSLAVRRRSILPALAAAVLIFVIIGSLSLLRKNAPLWTFLFVAAASLPVNIYLSRCFIRMMEYEALPGILFAFGCCCVLLSVEEIAFAIAVKLLFPPKRAKER